MGETVVLFQVLRELVVDEKMTILDVVTVKDPVVDLRTVEKTESRVFLLYSTKEEAANIMKVARKIGITRSTYVWVVTQPVIGERGKDSKAPNEFPVGMLG